MLIYTVKDYDEMSKKAANIIAAQILFKPNSNLGLATGSTPEGLYAELVKKYENGELNFENIQSFNLDEYYGLEASHNQSYRFYMNKHLFSKINILTENTHLPNGTNLNSDEECNNYETSITNAGGIDLQLLGLGNNGHIGFNEPSDNFSAKTNCVDLTQSTLEANSRFFDNDISKMPTKAYTMGIGTIMRAEKILLVVSGEGKAEILNKALFGKITPEVPASILQLHKNVIVVADEAASKYLKK